MLLVSYPEAVQGLELVGFGTNIKLQFIIALEPAKLSFIARPVDPRLIFVKDSFQDFFP